MIRFVSESVKHVQQSQSVHLLGVFFFFLPSSSFVALNENISENHREQKREAVTFLMLRRYAFVCFEVSYSEAAVLFCVSAVSSLAAFIGEKRHQLGFLFRIVENGNFDPT